MGIPLPEQRKLFQRSGNMCAFPGCSVSLTAEATPVDPLVVLGEIAHIVAASVRGPRGDSPLTRADRDRYENLILLCNQHHQLIDSQPNRWSVDELHNIKAAHENWVAHRLGSVDGPAEAQYPDRLPIPDNLLPSTDEHSAVALITNCDSMVQSEQSKSLPAPGIETMVETLADRGLPIVASLDPYSLGATPSRFGNHGDYGLRDPYVPRTFNAVDARVAHALHDPRIVIVTGPSKAGKTRTAFEAIRTGCPTAALVAPAPSMLHILVWHSRISATSDPIVVWLDDLDRFLTHTNALTPVLLARLFARNGPTTVIATLRSEARDRLRGNLGEFHRNTRLVLERAVVIDLAATSDDPAEQDAAAQIYPDHDFSVYGLGELLAGAPEMLARYDDSRHTDPLQHAVIDTVIDWARVGRRDPIPQPMLIDLAAQAIRSTRPDIEFTHECVHRALVAARKPPTGAGRVAALISSHIDDRTRGYRPFDYLLAAADGQGRAPRHIPDTFWQKVIAQTANEVLLTIGFTALERKNWQVAFPIIVQAASDGEPEAMYAWGVLLLLGNQLDLAESWLRESITACTTHARAMFHLGVVHDRRGNRPEAESWYRNAAELGHAEAMCRLAIRLDGRRQNTEAEAWYLKAARAGDSVAMFNLGARCLQRGETSAADAWFLEAAEAGQPRAMSNVAITLEKRGDIIEAERWYQKAVAADDLPAMNNLAVILERRGELDTAEILLRRASDAGHPSAMMNLAQLLAGRGELAESETPELARTNIELAREAGIDLDARIPTIQLRALSITSAKDTR
ncbi:tetratricopeptide repeat protein [Nocardia sp. CNY236]|uniref:tetratricopeptide repeat protein n=1 Tax=Nocardia sp. CNY236 TaxID=1169152 RepID=UPI000410CCF5|nr:tetratricopeptide repeat protein [Nocardia sp. CNY236]